MIKNVPRILADTMFQALKEMDKPTPPITCALRLQLISAMLLTLIDARADPHLRPYHNWNLEWTIKKTVINSLEVDTCWREEVTAEEIGA